MLYFSFLYFVGTFNKTITPLTPVGYEIVISNSVLCTSWSLYHVISSVCTNGAKVNYLRVSEQELGFLGNPLHLQLL